MKNWKFLLNGNELSLDLENWDAIKFKISRNKEYWGYTRMASLDKLIFLKEDAQTIKAYFEIEGVNSQLSFEIKKLNKAFGLFETFQNGVIDLYNYKEYYDSENKLYKLEADIVDSSVQQKLKSRELINLEVGKALSIENSAITSFSPIDVLYKSRPILNEGFFAIASIYEGVVIPDLNLNNRDLTIPTQSTSNNIVFLKESALGAYNVGDVSNLLLEETALIESSELLSITANLAYDLNIECTGLLAVTNAIKLKVQALTFDGVTFTLQSSTVIDSANITTFANVINLSGTYSFTKTPNFLYRLCLELDANVFDPILNASTINYDYLSLSSDSSHKSFLIYDVFDSLIQEITDQTNIFRSNLMGLISAGYSADGIASGISVTNGLFLRNATFSDATMPSLQASFKDLYDTIDAIYGIAMWWDGSKINIELREDAFGSENININPSEITRELITNMLYTSVKVGNKQIKYENINGTNEHNTTLEFSSPLRIKANTLNLITKYNTDYLGIELARRLSFATDDNIDTKYDEKVFLCKVEYNGSEWESVLGLNGGFTLIEGVILPDYAGNLDFSPKRMLLNNSDLISASMWKNESDFIRFEKSENLAALVTKKTGESVNLVELADVNVSDMLTPLFIPMKWTFEANEVDLWKIINNQNAIFTFDLDCKTIQGYLWSAEIQNDLAKIELIEKYENT